MPINVTEVAGRGPVDESVCVIGGRVSVPQLGRTGPVGNRAHLTLGEHRVVDLVAHLGLAQSTVSAHLACLRDCGLVESRPVGRASVFSLYHGADVQGMSAATGDAVVLCPVYGNQGGPNRIEGLP